jgi:hypothetical protein
LKGLGLTVIHLSDLDVKKNIDGVLKYIETQFPSFGGVVFASAKSGVVNSESDKINLKSDNFNNENDITTIEKLELLYQNGYIEFSKNGTPSYKRYLELSSEKGLILGNV